MNVLLVSQCNKSALVATRRILDQFAERKGNRTWQTAITLEGLKTLHKLLRKKARRNTAVACHWIKSGNRTELLWIVGNIRKFNEQGTTPTNITTRDVLRSQDENQWHTIEDIAILAGIAGLFHDFGKANRLFQKKLDPKSKNANRFEPYRHEWVSLRLFASFVKNAANDRQWLTRLANLDETDEEDILHNLCKDSPSSSPNPFKSMPRLAQAVGWLIVSHHRQPKFNNKEKMPPKIENGEKWITGNNFDASWNSNQCLKDKWSKEDISAVWSFKAGTPFKSKSWRNKARQIAKRALKRTTLVNDNKNWFADNFSLHLSRLVLMLADHCYSAGDPTVTWQDPAYKAYANTDKKTKQLKQKLDEHNIGVGHNAILLARSLPKIRDTLPAVTRHKAFKQRSTIAKFHWQNKAYELACNIRERSQKHGFFGINMASTGCGKTLANGRIMYGLADEKLGCRFSVALGLRTLTLQTGDALRERLMLDEEDLAVLIGSQAVRELHEHNREIENSGSESAEDFFAEHQYVRYEGSLDDGRLSRWLTRSPKLYRLLSAPILVSTIDHLIPATEGERGGKQIAPMLRLLTSDLILDEPDDFDLKDLPALTRLVNWAGMLGSRVLLSSATLPPALVEALFDAYRNGREHYQRAIGDPDLPVDICCAWFDEDGVSHSNHSILKNFITAHQAFVAKRSHKLINQPPLRKVDILPMTATSTEKNDIIETIAGNCHQAMQQLHRQHHQTHPQSGKAVSIGLLRIANINPLVAIARQLFTLLPDTDYRIHYCIYHSQHPLAIRSAMEFQLDKALLRKKPDNIWQVDSIQQALKNYPEQHHLFIVLATAVAEVGRDHDYDWAISEPSSMRSLIQLAGRIQRHRQQQPVTPNLLVWSTNYNALTGKSIAYTKPGFESKKFKLNSKNLSEIILPEQLNPLTAVPRIQQREQQDSLNNLADLEHTHLYDQLFWSDSQEKPAAAHWWENQVSWCFELQQRTPFRESRPDDIFLLHFQEEDKNPTFYCIDNSTFGIKSSEESNFKRISPLKYADRVQPWMENNFQEIIQQLAQANGLSIDEACRKFGETRLPTFNSARDEKWLYHPILGAFREAS
jgi:CRISPR-associated endonuclease/helicase Cas3